MQVYYTKRFTKSLEDLDKKVRTKAKNAVGIFCADRQSQKLRVHKLKGRLVGSYAMSVDFSHRIVFDYLDKKGVVLLDIGSHDVYEI